MTTKPFLSTASRPLQVLDPTLLGRPVHLLPRFAAQLGDDLAATLRAPSARRDWGGYQLRSVEFVREPMPGAVRWLSSGNAQGSVKVAFERALLLAVLDGRYGGQAGAAQLRRGAETEQAADRANERVTATEERLTVSLAQQMLGLLSRRITANLAGAGVTAAPPRLDTAVPGPVPARGSWIIAVVLTDAKAQHDVRFWMALDGALLGAVLQGLMPERVGVLPVRRVAEPLASTLQLQLDARLVSKEITLAALFELQAGDVIPVSLGRADVLLDDAQLFTAAVSESKGQLCLTSFENAE